MGLNLTCGCNWHNPGEEQHIEIFVGIPEDDDPSDPKYDNIETFLEQFVNKIGDAENEGEKWGDASFQWISDNEIFGELWPLEQSQVNESDNSKSIKVIVRVLRPRKGEKPWTIKFTDGTSEEYESQSEVWDRMEELGEEFAGRDRVGRDWDFISTRRKTSESTKNVNEVSGWDLEDEDLTLVNSESDGDKLYIVKLWWGSGYQMDCYNAYAFNEEEALNYVVAYIEKEDPGILEMSDEAAATLRTELADENGLENSLEAEDLPEFQESFMYVDATMEGASDTHYIWAENLQIAEYPKEHDYPMSKGIKKESKTPILRHVHQEIQKDLNEMISAANNAIQKIDIMVGNPKNDDVKDKLYEIRDILMKALPYNKIRAKGIKMESKRRRTRRVNESSKKIMLTWDEYNKLCDLIDMDWKRWNKRRAKNVEIVADRALEHLGWITSKDFTGQSPKDVEISFTIPDAGADEFSTGIPKSMTIYELIDDMCWTESTEERKFGKKFNESDEGNFDDMEKEFTYLGVTITRYDYESLPSPMAASKCSDRTMQAIAKDIQEDLVALGWSPKEIRKYLSDVDNYDYD